MLRFVRILSLSLCFVSEVGWDNGACVCADERGTGCVSAFLLPPSQVVFAMPPELPIPVDSWCMGIQGVQGKCVTSTTEQTAALRGHFPSKPQCKKEGKGFKETQTTKGPYHILSDSCNFPIEPTTYTENDDIEAKGKIGQPTAPFPFRPSLPISKPKVESVARMRTHPRSEIKTVELFGCRIPTLLERMKYICIYDLWNINCAISQTSSVLLYLSLKWAVHSVNMKGQTSCQQFKILLYLGQH